MCHHGIHFIDKNRNKTYSYLIHITLLLDSLFPFSQLPTKWIINFVHLYILKSWRWGHALLALQLNHFCVRCWNWCVLGWKLLGWVGQSDEFSSESDISDSDTEDMLPFEFGTELTQNSRLQLAAFSVHWKQRLTSWSVGHWQSFRLNGTVAYRIQ